MVVQVREVKLPQLVWENLNEISKFCSRAIQISDKLTAQGEMNRTWIVPSSDGQSEVRLNLREPGQTGDDLGLKTWSTSYTIAKRLGIYLSNIAELTKMSLPVKDISIHGNKVEKPLAIE